MGFCVVGPTFLLTKSLYYQRLYGITNMQYGGEGALTLGRLIYRTWKQIRAFTQVAKRCFCEKALANSHHKPWIDVKRIL